MFFGLQGKKIKFTSLVTMKKINDKENSNNLDDQSNSESFLKRWSVNKSKSKDTDVFKQVSDLESSETLNHEIAAEEKQIEEELKLTDDELADKYEVSNPDKINRELLWKPQVDFETGLKKTIAWYLKRVEFVDYDASRIGIGRKK